MGPVNDLKVNQEIAFEACSKAAHIRSSINPK